jgi:cytochrome c oxidase subunit 3
VNALRPTRVVGSVSHLPTAGSGPASVSWWGDIGFMLIEGTAFVLAAGAYIYLMSQAANGWPPKGDALPGLTWSGVFTVVLVASLIPNHWLNRKATAKNARAVRRGSVMMSSLGLVLLAIRGFELAHLGVHWSDDAYASCVWLLMVLHTSHVVAELGEGTVQAAWLSTHEIEDLQYADVQDNCAYWDFVVLTWLPIYVLVYWVPRFV